MTALRVLTRSILLAGAGALLAAAPAAAQSVPGQPDPRRGAEIAEKLCSACHLLPGVPAPADRVKADVPTFREIANLEGQSAERLRARMIIPVHPMPEIPLERDHIGHLAAYIISLRQSE